MGGEAIVFYAGSKVVKSLSLDYYVTPQLMMDRIVLHNYLFPETALTVVGFGRYSSAAVVDADGREFDLSGAFTVLVEQPYVRGTTLTDIEIEQYAAMRGFVSTNKSSWGFRSHDNNIALSDMHNENVLKTVDADGSTFVAVIDADIRLNDAGDEVLRRKGATRRVERNAALNGAPEGAQ